MGPISCCWCCWCGSFCNGFIDELTTPVNGFVFVEGLELVNGLVAVEGLGPVKRRFSGFDDGKAVLLV